MMHFDNRWSIVALAAGFNLLFEYSLRGYTVFLSRPMLPFFLFAQYFAIYTMVEDLVVRFKLTNTELALVMWPIGLVPMTLGTGVVFANPQFLGINWLNLIFVELVWWWLLQGLLTLYFANRVVQRDWTHKRLSVPEWLLVVSFFLGSFLVVRIYAPPVAGGTPIGWAVVAVLMLLPILILSKTLRNKAHRAPEKFHREPVLDVLSFASVVLFVLTGTVLGGTTTLDPASSAHINLVARSIIIVWSTLCAVVLAVRYAVKKKNVPI